MKDKGIDELLYAINKVHEKGNDVYLDIIGTHEENYAEALDRAQKTGIVQYHGFQSDVNSFIKKAHCVVLPSYHEGMSNVLLEGAAIGRPLIASDIPGCREIVQNGVNGFVDFEIDVKFIKDEL